MRAPSIPRPVAAVRLDGGRPCLDFINTIHDRDAAEPEDYICTPARFVAWSVRAGLLAPHEARNIKMPADHSRLMREITSFRTSLHRLLSARINRLPIPPSMTREINEWMQRAWRDLAVDPQAKDSLRWRERAKDVRLPLKRIALSALELLSEGNLARLKCCSNPSGCGWLFYDETRNNQRRWCAMETCGTLAKISRFRARRARGVRVIPPSGTSAAHK
jgi:predicted RNA-binding Zn ribbon-like protein